VASLIATVFLFLGSAQAQNSTMQLKRFSVEQHQQTPGNFTGFQLLYLPDDGIPRASANGKNFNQFFRDLYTAAMPSDRQFNWMPNDDWTSILVERLNADGTAPAGLQPVHLFYIPSKNSLAWVTKGMKSPELGLGDEDLLDFFKRNPNVYQDNGPLFAVKLPSIRSTNGGKPYRYCKTGRQAMYFGYNGFTHVIFTNQVDFEQIKLSPNWSRVVPDSDLYAQAGMVCVPLETKGLWVANANPSQTDPVTGFSLQGSYFDFSRPDFPRTDYGMGSSGFLSVDNSRHVAYFTQGAVRINRLKLTAANNPLDLGDNTPLLAALVDKVTGKLVVVEGGTIGGGVWIQDPKNPLTMAPPATNYLRARDARGANGFFNEEFLRAQMVDDGNLIALWRGTDHTADGYTKGQLIVYNTRNWVDRGARTTVTVQLPGAPATAGPVRLGPPAFDPINRRFWVNYGLQRAYGSVTFSEDFTTATVGEMKFLPLEDGADQNIPTALFFDSAMNRLYIASHRYGHTNGFLAADLAAYSADGNTRLASVRLPSEALGLPGNPVSLPSGIAVVPRGGVNMIAVSSSGTNTIVLVDPSMQVVGSMVTLRGRHIAPAVR